MPDSADKRPTGRPSDFTDELGEAICQAIATTPRGLDFICSTTEAFPSASTVHRWLTQHEAFRESYLRARERQADLIFDECLEIADDDSADYAEVVEGREEQAHGGALKRSKRENPESVQRAKLRIDTRMRMAGKLAPKKYGDKLDLSSSDGSMSPRPTVIEFVAPQLSADESDT